MQYVVTNGKKFYYPEVRTNKVCKTENVDQAFLFSNEKPAKELVKRASKKLKGFHVEPIICEASETLNPISKEKRILFSCEEREEVYNKYEGHCGICGQFVPYSVFTIDHIVPLSKGGTNKISNLQCACRSCNTLKQDILSEDLNNKLLEILTYYMRQHPKDHSIWKQIKKIHKEIKIAKKFKK